MSLDRRITAIRLLQRIKQHEIDGHAARLASIRARQTALGDEIENLIRMRDSEGHASTPEAAPFLAGFLRAIRARNDFLTGQLSEMDLEAANIEAELQAVFAESKANESALSSTEAEVKLERERAEIATAEEIARNMYLRKRRRSGACPW